MAEVCIQKVCVVGAGASGLCAARLLSALSPQPEIKVFERTEQIGGVWVYSDEPDINQDGVVVHGRMYKGMRTNLPKEIMGFSNFPFKPSYESFIEHEEVLKYLQDFTSHFNIHQFIQLLTTVVEVTPVKEGDPWTGWRVKTEEREGTRKRKTEVFDAIVIANGHYYTPKMTVKGIERFKGKVSHCYGYRDPVAYKGDMVLIVGAGPSGKDIVTLLAQEAKHIYLSHRQAHVTAIIPENVTQVPCVQTITETGAILDSGEAISVDSILLCTGYEFEFPFLAPECGIAVDKERVTTLYKHLFNVKYPTMVLPGIPCTILPWPFIEMQMKLVLSVWFGSKSLPSHEDMIQDCEHDCQERHSQGIKAHVMGPLQWPYTDELAKMAGVPKYPPRLEDLYRTVHEARARDLVRYKDKRYTLNNRGLWEEVS